MSEEQTNLFDYDPKKQAKTDGPETSKEAARRLDPTTDRNRMLLAYRRLEQKARTYEEIKEGFTAYEAGVEAGVIRLGQGSHAKRNSDLKRDDLIVRVGVKISPQTGRPVEAFLVDKEGDRLLDQIILSSELLQN